ncbi:hypothetical protein BDR05DRAFT_1003661 [Suillus weaverae]|nr:hypothetical protein BDR05DRAFT_1003661 [Suillus weaverae]
MSDAHPQGQTANWAELPNDDEIGDVPDFQSHESVSYDDSRPSTPRIPLELKGKSVETVDRQEVSRKDIPPDWQNHLNELDKLKNQIRELQKMVIQNQSSAEEAHKKLREAHRAPIISGQGRARLDDLQDGTRRSMKPEGEF